MGEGATAEVQTILLAEELAQAIPVEEGIELRLQLSGLEWLPGERTVLGRIDPLGKNEEIDDAGKLRRPGHGEHENQDRGSQTGEQTRAPVCEEKSAVHFVGGVTELSGNGAGRENRTLMTSLEGWSFTIKLYPRFPRYFRFQ